MSGLAFKPNAAEAIARLRRLYARKATDRAFASFELPSPALAEFARRYPHGFCEYPDLEQRVDFWRRRLAERAALEDDSIPSAYLSEMDQGLYGGLFGGRVQFMAHPENGWISSMVAPLLADFAEFDRLAFDSHHEWFQRYLRQLHAFVAAARGKFGVSHFILINGLNFVFELVGATQTYLSLDERPDWVRQAIEAAFHLNRAIQRWFFERVGLFKGGTFSNMVEWIPGRIVSESIDPFHMTSVGYFEEWGRPVVERIFAEFDGGVIHIHGNGRHLLEAASTLRGLKAIFLGDDKGFPLAFDVLEELRRRSGDVPLVVQTDLPRFVAALDGDGLIGGVHYKVSGAASADEVNRLMDRVRQSRRPARP